MKDFSTLAINSALDKTLLIMVPLTGESVNKAIRRRKNKAIQAFVRNGFARFD